MRQLTVRYAALAALSLGQPAVAAAPSGAIETIERVAPGVWSIHQRQPFHVQPVGNVELIEQSRGLVMVDGGGSPGSARRIVSLIKSVSTKPVTAIAITHWHGDHSLGVGTILQTWPKARVIAATATRGHILGASMERYPVGAPDPSKTKAFLEEIAAPIASFRKAAANPSLPAAMRAGYASNLEDLELYQQDIQGMFLPDKIEPVATRRILADPVRPVELRFLGNGNTDGDLVAWLPRQRILATGDLVVAPIPFGYDSYPASWQAVFDKLIALHARVIIPGHGLPMRNDAYLRLLRGMLADLRARMAIIGPKEELAQAKKDIAPSFAPYLKRIAGSDPWLQSWFVKSWQDPISEALWKESRGLPIEQEKG
jgi:glyoxylase-like metal-dependent hydrolase (beta-lactamase superfamily II)